MDNKQTSKPTEMTCCDRSEDGLWGMAREFYSRQMLCMFAFVWFWALVFLAGAVYCGVRFFRTDETRLQIAIAAGFVCFVHGVGLMKVFAWQIDPPEQHQAGNPAFGDPRRGVRPGLPGGDRRSAPIRSGQAPWPRPMSLTKRTSQSWRRRISWPRRSTTTSIWAYSAPRGMTIRPPSASWSIQAGGTSRAAAPQMIRSNGACSGQPRLPSCVHRVTLATPRPPSARGPLGEFGDALHGVDVLGQPSQQAPSGSRCRPRRPGRCAAAGRPVPGSSRPPRTAG